MRKNFHDTTPLHVQVRIRTGCVRLEGITIELGKRKWSRVAAGEPLVAVAGGAKVVMKGCRVDGGFSGEVLTPNPSPFGPVPRAVPAVHVEEGGYLSAKCSRFSSSKGCGLEIKRGGRAVMEGCESSCCGGSEIGRAHV